jgi:DNA-3-methyladenine glycosylase II
MLRILDLDLLGHKTAYLHTVADAALDGRLDGATLRSMEPDDALRTVQEVKGLGPFAAELVVIRGANSPDIVPLHERRLEDEITVRYGPGHSLTDVSEVWQPFRTWAAVHLRILREQRTHEISGRPAPRES